MSSDINGVFMRVRWYVQILYIKAPLSKVL